MDNYEKLVEKIASVANLEIGEIIRRVEAKRAKLSGLVSKEGAAQIVAAELGINFDQEKLKLSELVQGMKKANVCGKVLSIFPVREFNKNGREGKVGNLMIGDDSAAARVVLWDINHINLIEKGEIKVGDVLEISGASIRNGELHLSSFADIKKSSEKIENVVEQERHKSVKLDSVKNGELVSCRAFIVQSFEPRYFEVCPNCNKRAVENKCNEHGIIKPEKKALLNVVIDDGNESLRCVLFGEQIEKLGLSKEEVFDLDKFASKKEEILGKEMVFSGRVRINELYNTTELTVNGAEEVNPEILIKELESKAV